ncbi:MAG TPA: VWA domain-containing protein [Roseomonas sp.]|jgi:Ca-activated chloride channel family protein
MRRLLAVLLLTLLASCGPDGPREFTIMAGSEQQALEPIVQEFCGRRGVTCRFVYQGSLDIGLSLRPGIPPTADAVWPAASLWIDLFDTERRVRHTRSISLSPVVLGVRAPLARELGWVGREVGMQEIVAAVRARRLRFLMTSATQSNSGAAAFLAMLAAADGAPDVIEPESLDRPQVAAAVRDLLAGVERSSGSSGWLMDLFLDGERQGRAYGAMWNYETVLKETNDQLRTMGRDLLVAITPRDGVAVADAPLGFLPRPDAPKAEAFFLALQEYLLTPAVQTRIAATGRRPAFGSQATLPPAEPDWGFDPARPLVAIRPPDPQVLFRALGLYQSGWRHPSLTAICLDVSGSMEGRGIDELRAAMRFLLTPARMEQALTQWTPADHIMVFTFNHQVQQRFEATGAAESQAGLLRQMEGLSAGGGTDIYSCAAAAVDALHQRLAKNPGSALPAVLLMTDGRSEGSSAVLQAAEASARRTLDLDIPVFGILFGDAERGQLDAIATATRGRVFDGRRDLEAAFRAARGYN